MNGSSVKCICQLDFERESAHAIERRSKLQIRSGASWHLINVFFVVLSLNFLIIKGVSIYTGLE